MVFSIWKHVEIPGYNSKCQQCVSICKMIETSKCKLKFQRAYNSNSDWKDGWAQIETWLSNHSVVHTKMSTGTSQSNYTLLLLLNASML